MHWYIDYVDYVIIQLYVKNNFITDYRLSYYERLLTTDNAIFNDYGDVQE